MRLTALRSMRKGREAVLVIWYCAFVKDLLLDRTDGSARLKNVPLSSPQAARPSYAEKDMTASQRRHATRYSMRMPLRFRAVSLSSDKSEHFTEALNISRGGFFFASSAPLQVGVPLEVTLRMPTEVTGNKAEE